MVTVRSLQKWHGAGNDFLVDVRRAGEGEPWTSDLVRAVCARATGVGADGLLVADLGDSVSMTLYNADGSLAEMSGNGARCLAAAVRRATNSDRDELVVRTAAGMKTVRLSL
jgi:diaminopimelate epimerase